MTCVYLFAHKRNHILWWNFKVICPPKHPSTGHLNGQQIKCLFHNKRLRCHRNIIMKGSLVNFGKMSSWHYNTIKKQKKRKKTESLKNTKTTKLKLLQTRFDWVYQKITVKHQQQITHQQKQTKNNNNNNNNINKEMSCWTIKNITSLTKCPRRLFTASTLHKTYLCDNKIEKNRIPKGYPKRIDQIKLKFTHRLSWEKVICVSVLW
jgi:hypothetical protein